MGRARIRAVGALVALLVAAGTGVAAGDPLFDPIDPELPAPVPGAWDLPDPPLVAAPDLDMAALDVPAQHPWMLFDAGELPAIRQRVLGADPASVVGRAWAGLRARADACCDGRSSPVDALAAFPERLVGRDDLAELGFAWQITGDATYLDKARTLLGYLLATAPDHGAPLEPGVDEFYIQRAHRLNGFALAYDLLHPGLTPGERGQLLGIIAALGGQQFAHSTTAWWGTLSSGSNIGAVNAASLATAGLAVWHDLPAARGWVLRGEQLTRAYFHEGFDADGAGIEGVLYGNYGMRVPTFLVHALARAGQPGLDRVGGVDRHQEWVAYEVLPGGGAVNPMNDARYHEFNPYFTAWSSTHGDTPELSRWIFDQVAARRPDGGIDSSIPVILWHQPPDPGFDPSSVLPPSQAFDGRGLLHVRSGWSAGDLMAAFESRQNDWGEAVHQNHDVNNFVLYADGARLVVDSRYANWLAKKAAGDEAAARTSLSHAHNTVIADGRSQDFFGKGDLVDAVSSPGLDLALGDARKAYMTDQPHQAERIFLHVRAGEGAADYLVIADRFHQGDGRHRHSWFLHTDWANTMRVTGPGRVRVDAPNGAGLEMTMHASQPFNAAVESFTPDDAEDWEHLGGGRRAQPRLRVTSDGPSFHAITVLVPTAPGEQPPVVRAEPRTGAVSIVVDHGDVQDHVYLPPGWDVRDDGFGFSRSDATGRRLRSAAVGGDIDRRWLTAHG